MKKVFMVHGFQGEPNGGWRPWLMGKLAKKDIWACSLAMPEPNNPKKDDWVKEITRAIGEPNEETFLVGHSLGAPTVLRYLESLPDSAKVGGVLLVSGPAYSLNQEKYILLDHFINYPFDFEKIRKVCKKFAVIHGDNDADVPFEHGVQLSKNLNCELISIPHGEHLSGSQGWYELPEVLQALEEMIK